MTNVDIKSLIHALHKDLSSANSYGPSITLEYIQDRADLLLAGNKPSNGPDMFIQGALKKAGYLK